jgi:hypothetical protein
MNNLEAGIASLRTWSQVARGTIALFLFVLVLLIIANSVLLYFELTASSGANLTVWEPAAGTRDVNAYGPVFAFLLGGSVVLLGVFFLLGVVPVAGWIYRAHANLRDAEVAELRYSPGGRLAASSCRSSTSWCRSARCASCTTAATAKTNGRRPRPWAT